MRVQERQREVFFIFYHELTEIKSAGAGNFTAIFIQASIFGYVTSRHLHLLPLWIYHQHIKQ